MAMLSNHVHTYALVRGWRARRIYVTDAEWSSADQVHFGKLGKPGAGVMLYCGAEVRRVLSQDVAEQIRRWDLRLPPGKEANGLHGT